MAQIIGGIGISHVPAIGGAIARGLQNDPYWAPFFGPVRNAQRWVAAVQPDAVVVVYNDHGLNFFLNAMPTFAVGACRSYHNEDEGWGLPVQAARKGDPDLSWRLIDGLVARDFDITICQEMLIDHACTVPLSLLWPDGDAPPIVPVAVNIVQHPMPSPRRCFALGQAIGDILAAEPSDRRILVLGTGGLSHQLEGSRAGFINREFDELCLNALAGSPERLLSYSSTDLAELAGSQGVEVLNWLVMRGALPGAAHEVLRNYHVPISNTASGLLVLAA